MNTPRSKPPKRHSRPRPPLKGQKPSPDGRYHNRLPRTTEHAALLGELVAYWAQVEEQMIEFLGLLLGDRELPTRQIFHSIRSEQTRIKMLKALLEEAPINNTKGEEYDDIIARFSSLNTARNAYVHGLWSVHESGQIYLAEASSDEIMIHRAREVKAEELSDKLRKMGDLWRDIFRLTDPEVFAALWRQPSQGKRPLPPSSKTS